MRNFAIVPNAARRLMRKTRQPLSWSQKTFWLAGESLLTCCIGEHGYGLQFCKSCGSTLCTIRNGRVFQIMQGCVNDSPDIEIDQHFYVGLKANWEVIPDGITQFQDGLE